MTKQVKRYCIDPFTMDLIEDPIGGQLCLYKDIKPHIRKIRLKSKISVLISEYVKDKDAIKPSRMAVFIHKLWRLTK